MFRLLDSLAPSRRELLSAGALGVLSLPNLLAASDPKRRPRSCIVLWISGGPPQQETWDPKPAAPAEVRGPFGTIATRTPGLRVCELMPKLAGLTHKVAVLRAVVTDIHHHSSSGYEMLTGFKHPLGQREVAGIFDPFDRPSLGGIVRHLVPDRAGTPSAVTLPEGIFNNPRDAWPGQNGGFLGRNADPWLMTCDPSAPSFRVPELELCRDVTPSRLDERRRILAGLDRFAKDADSSTLTGRHEAHTRRAAALLTSPAARRAFDLDAEADAVRDRYGRHKFGQSCLLARRLVEAGVRLVQVNWPREKGDSTSSNPLWDTHAKNAERLKSALMPPMDLACSALIEDLDARGLLDDTLVVWMGEFGRTPRINGSAGRDHWGGVFSVMLAGGGVKGGVVRGISDSIAAYPVDGKVTPADLATTVLHCVGVDPHSEVYDPLRRPVPVSRGRVLREVM